MIQRCNSIFLLIIFLLLRLDACRWKLVRVSAASEVVTLPNEFYHYIKFHLTKGLSFLFIIFLGWASLFLGTSGGGEYVCVHKPYRACWSCVQFLSLLSVYFFASNFSNAKFYGLMNKFSGYRYHLNFMLIWIWRENLY